MSEISVVRGMDGKVLGVSCSDGTTWSRADADDDWDFFCRTVAALAFTRIPVDTESDFAKKLLAEDDKRLIDLGFYQACGRVNRC